jgi:hypothetical protein
MVVDEAAVKRQGGHRFIPGEKSEKKPDASIDIDTNEVFMNKVTPCLWFDDNADKD